MQRPTAFYPSPPKIEHFVKSRNHVTSLSLHGGNGGSSGANNPGIPAPPVFNNALSPGMDEKGYQSYLVAHKSWIDMIHEVDDILHVDALRRRALESKKEVMSVPDLDSLSVIREIPIRGYQNPFGRQYKIRSTMLPKTETTPTLSTKPHAAEKRDAKKQLRNASVKAQVEVLKGRTALAAETNAASVKEKLSEVKKISDLKPLWRAEESAARSAAARSKSIRFGSIDLATNIVPDDGWKVVTRKKGTMAKQSQVTETANATTGIKTVESFVDAALPTRVSLASSVRLPTAVGSSK